MELLKTQNPPQLHYYHVHPWLKLSACKLLATEQSMASQCTHQTCERLDVYPFLQLIIISRLWCG